MFKIQRSFVAIFVGHFLLVEAIQTCYWPDNSVAGALTPCNNAAEYSHCCGSDGLCLSNGYCFNQGNEYGNRISRGGCTDESWNSDACPQYCQTISSNGALTISIISENGTGLFCCGLTWDAMSNVCLADSTHNDPRPFTLPTGVAIMNRTSGSTSLNSQDSAAATQPAAHSSIGTAIGAGVGASVGVLLFAGGLLFLWHLKKQTKHEFQEFEFKNSHSSVHSPGGPPRHMATQPLVNSSSGPPTPRTHMEHIELQDSPQPSGIGIQELDDGISSTKSSARLWHA